MRISIITPSLNQGKFIEQTIKSISDQNYMDVEHIVVDGRSSDGTHEILKKYNDAGTIIWYNYADTGQVDAINYGLKRSTGDIVCYLGSDDLLAPGSLKKVNELFSNKDVKWLTGDAKIINENNEEIQKIVRYYKKFLRMFSSYTLLGIANFIVQPSTFWRKDLVDEVGFLDKGLDYNMDYDYWSRLYKKHKLLITNTVLSCFRVHSDAKSSKYTVDEFNEGYVVSKRYFNKLITHLHRLHDKLIIVAYRMIKK